MPATLSPPADKMRAPLRILVADDNEMLRVAIRGLLRNLGHAVEVVANGREAVEAAAHDDYDLVFLDIQMPEMGGFEAARLCRQENTRGQPPRIVGLSGEPEDRETYAAAGMDDFLVKPIRLTDLVHVLKHFQRP